MSSEPPLKPVIWIGSSLRDLRGFPGLVQDHIGYALYVAQLGGKHRDAKVLAGFGGAGVLEVVKDYRGDTFPRGVHLAICPQGLRTSRVSEEIENWAGDAAP